MRPALSFSWCSTAAAKKLYPLVDLASFAYSLKWIVILISVGFEIPRDMQDRCTQDLVLYELEADEQATDTAVAIKKRGE